MPSDPSPRPMDLDQVAELLLVLQAEVSTGEVCEADDCDDPQCGLCANIRRSAAYCRGLAPLLREWVEAKRAYDAGIDLPTAQRFGAADEKLYTHLTQSTPTAPSEGGETNDHGSL